MSFALGQLPAFSPNIDSNMTKNFYSQADKPGQTTQRKTFKQPRRPKAHQGKPSSSTDSESPVDKLPRHNGSGSRSANSRNNTRHERDERHTYDDVGSSSNRRASRHSSVSKPKTSAVKSGDTQLGKTAERRKNGVKPASKSQGKPLSGQRKFAKAASGSSPESKGSKGKNGHAGEKGKAVKKGLHPRNPHRERYDFPALMQACPALTPFVSENPFGDLSIDFSHPEAVKVLNKALLKHFYQVEHWDIPQGYLCPPIPGRADYLHYIADLLAAYNDGTIPKGKQVRGLDIGTGANCVYPMVGHRVYGWHFVAADIDPLSVKSARFIVESNRSLAGGIQCRLQKNPDNIFTGMINEKDGFDFTMCNPPFHASQEEATAGSARKVKNLSANARKKGTPPKAAAMQSASGQQPVLNFGGQKAELWCPGGEAAFIRRMITQSVDVASQCFWFTTLVSKKDNLPGIYQQLKKVGAVEVKTIDMSQGQKVTRVVAWTFLSPEQQASWRQTRWTK